MLIIKRKWIELLEYKRYCKEVFIFKEIVYKESGAIFFTVEKYR